MLLAVSMIFQCKLLVQRFCFVVFCLFLLVCNISMSVFVSLFFLSFLNVKKCWSFLSAGKCSESCGKF